MDLTTTYLGLKLKNPIVASASPLSYTLEGMKQLEDAGISAIVMFSLFEEQIAHERSEMFYYLTRDVDSYAEALSYFPEAHQYHTGPEEYIDLLIKAKKSLQIPIIGSLNGISACGWIDYAKNIEDAGADALELNIYYIPTDPELSGKEIEDRYLDVLRAVKKTVTIPVAVKIGPFFSGLSHLAQQFDKAGADGLVLFNRFYQPDIDLETMDVRPSVLLSTAHEMRVPLRWVAILYGKIKANLAATSGIYTAEDVLKVIMAGADVAMMCSALLKHGPEYVRTVIQDMERWMTDNEYVSIQQMKGSMSQKSIADPSAFERANYMKTLHSYK